MSDRLFKRNGIWYGWFFTPDGEKVQRSTRSSDKTTARSVLREWERRAADPAYSAAHQTSLEEALNAMLTDRRLKGRAESTIKSYRVKAGHLLRLMGASTSLARIDARLVDSFIESRLDEGAVPNTISKELTVLRASLKVAKRRGAFDRDIAAVMPEGFSPEYKPVTRFLTTAEAEALFAELAPDRAARVAFILATGARLGESDRAQRGDIDVRTGYVRVRGTKTKASARIVPLVGMSIRLAEHALEYAEGTGVMFFRPWSNVRRDLADACERAKIEKVTPNDLRRTCATWLRQSEVEPHLIASVLGHTDSRMVERVYGRLPPESLKSALQSRVDPCSSYVAAGVETNASERPMRNANELFPPGNMVPGDGVEPPTRGFSILF